MPPKTEKTFDCIEFKRKVQAEHYDRTKHLTDDQWLADLRQCVADSPLGDWWRRIRRERDDAPQARQDDKPLD